MEVERNNELKAENEKLDRKRLNSEKTVGELRERILDEKNQVALEKGKAVEFVRRMDRADAEVRNLSAYIKSRAAVELAKDENLRQLRNEIDRLKRGADREEEVVRSKEITIEANNKNLEKKEMEICKIKLEMSHLKAKIESLQKELQQQ